MAKRDETVKTGEQQAEKTASGEAAIFSKEQFMKSENYTAVRDLLDALLSPEERLTTAQAEEKIQAFLTKEAL